MHDMLPPSIQLPAMAALARPAPEKALFRIPLNAKLVRKVVIKRSLWLQVLVGFSVRSLFLVPFPTACPGHKTSLVFLYILKAREGGNMEFSTIRAARS